MNCGYGFRARAFSAPWDDEGNALQLGQAPWQFWAVLSAVFAALTAIFAKIGVENVTSDLATLIRPLVVICVLLLIVFATGQFQDPTKISGRTYLFLVLSGLGTGA